MDKRMLLIEKIDKEFEDFRSKLMQYDVDEILNGAEDIAKMKTVRDFIKQDYIIKEEQLDFFLKLREPLSAICDRYNPNEVEIIDDLEHVIWEMEDKELLDYDANEESDKLVEIMRNEYKADGVIYGEQSKIFTSEALAESIFEKEFCFPEYDAKVLMQFKKPFGVLLDLYRDSRVESFEDQYPKIMEKIQSMDILTGPYTVDRASVLPETKYRHDIINKVIDLVPEPEYNTTARWLVFFREMNMEAADSCYENANPYERFGEALETIAYSFGDEVLQQLYELPNKHQPILENELVGAAEYLSNGGSIEEIPRMAEDGRFDTTLAEDDQQGGMDLC